MRFNMNAARLPLSIDEADSPGYFAAVAKVVRTAHRVDLVATLSGRERSAPMATPHLHFDNLTALRTPPNLVTFQGS
jgi:hypothetical protein